MYTQSSWRSYLGIVAVDLLHHEPARTAEDPFTAYIPREGSQISRLTNILPKILEKLPAYRGCRPSEPSRTLEDPYLDSVPGEVTFSQSWRVHRVNSHVTLVTFPGT